jgi:hypothetical protein
MGLSRWIFKQFLLNNHLVFRLYSLLPIWRILLRDVHVRIAQSNTPVIATVGFIVVIGYYLTTCFGHHGPSSVSTVQVSTVQVSSVQVSTYPYIGSADSNPFKTWMIYPHLPVSSFDRTSEWTADSYSVPKTSTVSDVLQCGREQR